MRSTSPSMLFSCRSSPRRKSPVPRPRLDVRTQTAPSASAATRFAQPRQPLERRGHAGESRARQHAPTEPRHFGRSLPARVVAREIVGRHGDALDRSQKLGDRALVERVGTFFRKQLERRCEPGLIELLAGLEQSTSRCVDALAVGLHREDGAEHRKAGGVGGRHRHALSRQSQCGIDDPRPRQAAVAPVERAEPARQPGNGARARSDRVMDEFLAEGNPELDGRRPLARGHVDEAVEIPRLLAVEVDRVPAAEQSGHHRLGDAGGKAGGDRSVRGRPALFEDLDPGRHGRRVAARNTGRNPGCNPVWSHGLLP